MPRQKSSPDTAPAPSTQDSLGFPTEEVAVSSLKPHPRNYRGHPEDQVEHLMKSIQEHGLYRNIVIARDGTILAGHGVVEAVRSLGVDHVPVVRLDVDPDSPAALKVLTGDNEISHLAAVDDRALTEILKEIRDADTDGLIGTGYDDKMLANLAFVTRPKSEIQDIREAEHWVGMPSYQESGDVQTVKLMVNFESEEDRERLLELIGAPAMSRKDGQTWSVWWPPRERNDLASLRFEVEGESEEEDSEEGEDA